MKYEFKQLTPGIGKKEVLFFVGVSLVILLVNFCLVILSEDQNWSAGSEISAFVLLNLIVLAGGITLFFKNNHVTKQIALLSNGIEVKEIRRGGNAPLEEYRITPEMIRCYRYVDGSETASRFEVLTHNPSLKLMIPNSLFTDNKKYNAFISLLDQWLKENQVRNCQDMETSAPSFR